MVVSFKGIITLCKPNKLKSIKVIEFSLIYI